MDEAVQRRRVLIIDGYNVIRNNGRYTRHGADYEGGFGWNKAREALINDAAYFAAGDYERCVVVFDGAGNPQSSGAPMREAGIEVVFSPAHTSADSVIEKYAFDAREKGYEVVVVSSDSAVQTTVFGGGVTRMSAASFGLASDVSDQDWHAAADARTHAKSTVAGRVPADVLEKLRRLRDGE